MEEPRFMNRRETSLRVVTVSRDGLLTGDELARLNAVGIACEQVASPYEAAAAMLAAPTAAVGVDMRLLTRKHLRMLDLARKLGVEVLGTGAIPAGLSADDLRGVRLLGRSELTEELLDGAGGTEPQTETCQPEESASVEGRYEPQQPEPAYQQQPRKPVLVDRPGEDDSQQPEASDESAQPPQQTPPQSTSDVLSSDEISALLEEDF